MAIVEACLQTDQPFVVDNTNVQVTDRSRYILPAREHEFRVEGYFISSTLDRCKLLNGSRSEDQRVPFAAILAKKKGLQYPSIQEGFDALFFVTVSDQGDFFVEAWRDEVQRP